MRISTAGDSHGEKLIGIIEGFPSNVPIDIGFVERQLFLRRCCYGRSVRSTNESDKVRIISGINRGETDGNPIALELSNSVRDVITMDSTIPRPGHADLIGAVKYQRQGTRSVIERASARETAMRVALSAVVRQLLNPLDIEIFAFTKRIGSVSSSYDYYDNKVFDLDFLYNSSTRSLDEENDVEMKKEIDRTRELRDSVGGEIQIVIKGLPIGYGSYTNSNYKLDSIFASELLSVQSVKGVSFGRNLFRKNVTGSSYHDVPIYKNGISHLTNNAGGIEGGMSNGEDIVIDVVLKPIPTLLQEISSFDIHDKEKKAAMYERSDITQIPASCTVVENVCAFVLVVELLKKHGSDSYDEFVANYKKWLEIIEDF